MSLYKYLLCLILFFTLSIDIAFSMDTEETMHDGKRDKVVEEESVQEMPNTDFSSSSSDIESLRSSEPISETEDNLFNFDLEELSIEPVKITQDVLTYRVRDKNLLEKFQEVSRIRYGDDEELVELIFVRPNGSISTSSSSTVVSPEWCKGLFVKKIGRTYYKVGNTVLGSNSIAGGKGSVSLSIQEQVQSGYSSTFSVTAAVVTAGVGFNVSKSYTVTNTGVADAQAGYETRITAYPEYTVQPFEIWDDGCIYDTKEGTGEARKPSGVHFSITRKKVK